MSSSTGLFDELSPRARGSLAFWNSVCTALVLVALAYLGWVFSQSQPMRGELWVYFAEPGVWWTIGRGLLATVRAAILCIVLSILFGAILGIARLADNRVLRIVLGLWIEFFRSIPSLLIILMLFLSSSRTFGNIGDSFESAMPALVNAVLAPDQWDTLGPLVLAVVIQHSAIMAEVFRGGIVAVSKGQSEAGYSIGMTRAQLLRIIVIPQAVRGMLPALVSECVRSLKATSLGYAIGYLDLLRTGQIIASAYQNIIPMALILLVIYVSLCLPLSWLASWIERRTSPARSPGKPGSTGRHPTKTSEGAS